MRLLAVGLWRHQDVIRRRQRTRGGAPFHEIRTEADVIDAHQPFEVVVLIQMPIQTDLRRACDLRIARLARVKVIECRQADDTACPSDGLEESIARAARVIVQGAHVGVAADHRHAGGERDRIEGGLLVRMAADVQNDALSVDFLHQALTGARKSDLRIEAAATEFIGDVVSDATNTQAKLSIGAQVSQLGFATDDQPLCRLPAREMGNQPTPNQLPNFSNAAGRCDLGLLLVEKIE
jgi:hypothetical protein